MNFSDRDEMHLLAGEYALGLMSSEEATIFEREIQRNPALVAAVGYWNDRLLALAPPQAEVEPSAGLWQRIERDLPRKTKEHQSHRSHRSHWSFSLWNNLSFWRASGLVGMIASAMLAFGLFTTTPVERAPEYLAVLQGENTGASWIVEISNESVLLRPVTTVSVPAGKALQFWTKPEGAAGPTSLGLIGSGQHVVVPLSKLPGISSNQLFEVTLEPESGSPIDRPTGAILALGKAIRL